MKAIVADDAQVYRDQAIAALRRFGIEIVGKFPDGAPAIEFLKTNPEVDLAVLDVVMLGTTGLEVAAWIKNNAHKAKVVLLTSMGQKGAAHQEGNQADAVCIKPYHPDQLIAKVVEAMDGKQS